MRVLLVEDNKMLRELLSKMFCDDGYTVVACKNGQEAWGLIEKGEAFDKIISDYHVPEMDGLELFRRVKDNAPSAHIPFVLMSADSCFFNNSMPFDQMGVRFIDKLAFRSLRDLL